MFHNVVPGVVEWGTMTAGDRKKVIVRLIDGRLIKGYLEDFSPTDDAVAIVEQSTQRMTVNVRDLKAIFFVRTFTGDKGHREKKAFTRKPRGGKRVFLRFKDGETMMGYSEGDIPWQRGFFLESKKGNGFFVQPVDEESNNIKVFVVASALDDVAVVF